FLAASRSMCTASNPNTSPNNSAPPSPTITPWCESDANRKKDAAAAAPSPITSTSNQGGEIIEGQQQRRSKNRGDEAYRNRANELVYQLREKWMEERRQRRSLEEQVRDLTERLRAKDAEDAKREMERENFEGRHEWQEVERRATVVMLKEGFS